MKKCLLVLVLFSGYAFAAPPQTPDSKLTPGVADPAATVKKICTSGYTAQVRDVTAAVKKQVFSEYGINPKSDHFEVDHLISLELGGSNDIKNLWPQSYTTSPYNAHIKDHLEDTLHSMVCKGKVDLVTAQKAIATDWIAAYKKYVK
jgi:hypothetical protein